MRFKDLLGNLGEGNFIGVRGWGWGFARLWSDFEDFVDVEEFLNFGFYCLGLGVRGLRIEKL